MSALPAELSTGMVHGRFIVAMIDGDDTDQEPDVIPASGKIAFKASVPYVPVPVTSEGPVTVLKGPITGVLDSDGYLCTPHPVTSEPMYRGVKLLATDDPDMAVTDWTWTAEYRLDSVGAVTLAIAAHSFALPSGSEVDLTTMVKVPSSPGYGLPQAEAAVLRAEAAAQVALDVKAMADAGEFDGATGPPGNATVRFSTTAGKAIYLTEPGTAVEHLIYGDTGWRTINELVPEYVSGLIKVRRELHTVIISIEGLVLSGAGAGVNYSLNLGSFALSENHVSLPLGGYQNGSKHTFVAAWSGTHEIRLADALPVSASVSFRVRGAWPSTLPGTASGTIPNL